MSITLPKFNLTVPSETTRFKGLGKELREFGVSVENVLASFTYDGADPNLVLSRVASLEAHVNAAPPPLPPDARTGLSDAVAITASPGTWQDIPGLPAITVTNPTNRKLVVRADFGAVIVASVGYGMLGIRCSGATTISPQAPTLPGDLPMFGLHTPFTQGNQQQLMGLKIVHLNPGSTTITMQSRRDSSGSHGSNYPTLHVTPVRYI